MDSFEDWVTANFGRRLYDAFFRSYTEKVWGIPGSEIHAEWAVQRIKDFSFREARCSRRFAPDPVPTSDDADRGVSVPTSRAGPNVGGVSRAHADERGIEGAAPTTEVSAIQHEL